MTAMYFLICEYAYSWTVLHLIIWGFMNSWSSSTDPSFKISAINSPLLCLHGQSASPPLLRPGVSLLRSPLHPFYSRVLMEASLAECRAWKKKDEHLSRALLPGYLMVSTCFHPVLFLWGRRGDLSKLRRRIWARKGQGDLIQVFE